MAIATAQASSGELAVKLVQHGVFEPLIGAVNVTFRRVGLVVIAQFFCGLKLVHATG